MLTTALAAECTRCFCFGCAVNFAFHLAWDNYAFNSWPVMWSNVDVSSPSPGMSNALN